MRMDPTPDRIAARLHQHYQEWFVGNGVRTEFQTAKTFGRVEDVAVYVAGARLRPDASGTAYDFRLRGLTPAYDGDKNAISFNAAPGNTLNVLIEVIST